MGIVGWAGGRCRTMLGRLAGSGRPVPGGHGPNSCESHEICAVSVGSLAGGYVWPHWLWLSMFDGSLVSVPAGVDVVVEAVGIRVVVGASRTARLRDLADVAVADGLPKNPLSVKVLNGELAAPVVVVAERLAAARGAEIDAALAVRLSAGASRCRERGEDDAPGAVVDEAVVDEHVVAAAVDRDTAACGYAAAIPVLGTFALLLSCT